MSDLTPEVIEEGLRLWEAASEASTLPRAASWGRVAAHARQHYGPALREVQRLRAEVASLTEHNEYLTQQRAELTEELTREHLEVKRLMAEMERWRRQYYSKKSEIDEIYARLEEAVDGSVQPTHWTGRKVDGNDGD